MVSKISVSVLIIALIAVGAFLFLKNNPQTATGKTITATTEKIVAYVNDHPITQEEIEKTQKYLEAQTGQIINQTDALKRVISEKLILDDAEKNGFTQSIEDTEKEISQILAAKNQTLTDFKKTIKAQGSSYEDGIEYYRQQLLINNYLNQLPKINITDTEALAYYNENKDKLFVGNMTVPFKQISQRLKTAMEKKQGQEEITAYLAKLHENAKIIYVN
ncbi:MAG: SurA N-terminal domain-containing protein [Nanoarchaeota archaeon]|nr:SurA N-terminal domain-containing protein [Nanoarchaeota archaeon]MBU0977152.1 SurA N-terminal domain-containing protein [Nanoarchaeota archaeon]